MTARTERIPLRRGAFTDPAQPPGPPRGGGRLFSGQDVNDARAAASVVCIANTWSRLVIFS